MSKELTSNELSLFCYQLSLIFKSGVPLMDAMDLFTQEMKTPELREIAKQMDEDISQGYDIHSAIAKHDVFPKYMVGMIEIAQNTGNLEEELQRLSTYYQEKESTNQKVLNAITYPIILLILMAMVIVFLVVKVLPMFNHILSGIGASVPGGTRVLLSMGMFVTAHFKSVGLILLALIVALVLYSRSKGGRLYFDHLRFRFPYVANINRKILADKFSLGMSMLISGGYSFDDALDIYIHSIDSPFVSERLEVIRQNIIDGNDVAEEFDKAKLFPNLFNKMLAMGYRTGEIENSLTKISSIYKAEVIKTMDRFTSSIEPVLVIILSVIVAMILFSVMLPLITIVSTL